MFEISTRINNCLIQIRFGGSELEIIVIKVTKPLSLSCLSLSLLEPLFNVFISGPEMNVHNLESFIIELGSFRAALTLQTASLQKVPSSCSNK